MVRSVPFAVVTVRNSGSAWKNRMRDGKTPIVAGLIGLTGSISPTAPPVALGTRAELPRRVAESLPAQVRLRADAARQGTEPRAGDMRARGGVARSATGGRVVMEVRMRRRDVRDAKPRTTRGERLVEEEIDLRRAATPRLRCGAQPCAD